MYKILLIILNIIFGSLVLFSYYNGVTKNPELSLKLWGGVPKVLHSFIISFMFVGAIGYFFFTAHLLLNIDVDYKFFGKFNYWYLHLIYLMILIPSALWIDLTFLYMKSNTSINWFYVVSCLSSVAFFSVILFLFIVDTYVDNSHWLYFYAVLGSLAFVFHTVFLDGLIWTFFFNKIK
mgnify:FL=1|tara:strand:- start:2442 stop:2975 length:534 start_codon:yes stop_codon:yes gene_type:complete